MRCAESAGKPSSNRQSASLLHSPLLGLGCLAGSAELGVGAVPGAFEGGDLSLSSREELGGGAGAEEGYDEVGLFGEEHAIELGFHALEASLGPIGAKHGIEVEGLGGGVRAEFGAVVFG